MRKLGLRISLLVIAIQLSLDLSAQESIFSGFRGRSAKADMYYEDHAYSKASLLFEKLVKKDKSNQEALYKLANCHYYLNNIRSAVKWFQAYERVANQSNKVVSINYSNALLATGDNEKAVAVLKKYSTQNPDDIEIARKIWQLENIRFLYEDSVFYHVKPASFNTEYDEVAPALLGSSLIIASNVPDVEVIQRMDGANDKPFYRWRRTARPQDSSNWNKESNYAPVQPFASEINAKFHKGSLTFTHHGDTMIYTKSGDIPANDEVHTYQLFFAGKKSEKWVEIGSFPFNSKSLSIGHPAVSEDSKLLYFSSDMPGGYGGHDLYYSQFVEGKWTKPENLGPEINTSQDESHPFLRKGILYFSSNGHPGLGGLDIFRVKLSSKIKEVINFGYPVNTAFDDFDLVLDSAGIHGYLVSNRNADNDNIYEIIMHKLTFPIVVNGNIKYKSTEEQVALSEMLDLAHAELELIEMSTNSVVSESKTDGGGRFSIEIPFESQFLLHVKQENFGKAVVSMEIPDNHLDYLNHEIVIVRE